MVSQAPYIYHVTTIDAWNKAKADGFFLAASVAIEGFMHACSLAQLPGVLERYYRDQKNLVRLTIDVKLLESLLKYEFASSVNEYFPHVYGPVNVSAIVAEDIIA